MKKINILAMALGLFAASCGDAPKATEENEMTHDEMHDHDGHDHDHDAMTEKAADAEPAAIPEGARVFSPI